MSHRTFASLVRQPMRRYGKRGRGTEEVKACRDEIVAMLDAGYLLSQVYRALSEQGNLSITYATFHRITDSFGLTNILIEPLLVSEKQPSEANKPPAETLPKDKGKEGSQ